MASYETEHASDPTDANGVPRRPDFSSFFSLVAEITPDHPDDRAREGAVPTPGDVSAAFTALADGFRLMQQNIDNSVSGNQEELLEDMIDNLMRSASRPPTEINGVEEAYIASLERVNIKKMKKDADCPICRVPFVDDPHPLLVRLPCHPTHVFDLECVRPWLLLNGTCPLDRVDLPKQVRDRRQKNLDEIKKNAAPEDEEEEWDGLYG